MEFRHHLWDQPQWHHHKTHFLSLRHELFRWNVGIEIRAGRIWCIAQKVGEESFLATGQCDERKGGDISHVLRFWLHHLRSRVSWLWTKDKTWEHASVYFPCLPTPLKSAPSCCLTPLPTVAGSLSPVVDSTASSEDTISSWRSPALTFTVRASEEFHYVNRKSAFSYSRIIREWMLEKKNLWDILGIHDLRLSVSGARDRADRNLKCSYVWCNGRILWERKVGLRLRDAIGFALLTRHNNS